MTDLEMTKLCADVETRANADALTDADVAFIVERFTAHGTVPTNAQAMALVKMFGLSIDTMAAKEHGWMVKHDHRDGGAVICSDLNLAIVECVAKIRAW